jgi:micrococcal nuclease
MGICLGTETTYKPDTNVDTINKPETNVKTINKPETNVEILETKPIPTWEDTIVFVPPITDGIVIKVYDGDTITIAQKLPYENSPLFRFAIRLNGIDSPEIKTKDESEKKYAERSRDALHQLIFQKTVTLRNISLEKYGRILADVYYNDIHVNKWLLDNKYAISYDGSKKREWNDVITLYEKSN